MDKFGKTVSNPEFKEGKNALALNGLQLLSSELNSASAKLSRENMNNLACEIIHDLKSKNTYTDNILIGEGGMGTVEQVIDTHCHRTIAKKTLHKECNSIEAYVRFTEEIQITAQLEHPNIIPIYEMGVDENNRIFYTMKLIQGRNLKEILKDIKSGNQEVIEKFPIKRLMQVFCSICDAMSYACSKNVVHRDLKPDNIMVGNHGEVYLVDWGLAKIIDDQTSDENETPQNIAGQLKHIQSLRDKIDVNISMNNVIVGTPHYMAPERFTGQADEVSEIYALGSILYNILTLNMTVHTDEVEKIMETIISGEIEAPSKHQKNLPHILKNKVPEALSAITMKALAPDREDRYQCIKDLISDINLWQKGLVTKAENAGFAQMLWSAIKKHRMEAFMSSACLFLGVFFYSTLEVSTEEHKKLFSLSEIKSHIQSQVKLFP